MDKIDLLLFDWLLWRSGSPLDLGVKLCRSTYLLEQAQVVRKYAIGYCDGSQLICRPKHHTKAVMFMINDKLFWFHLTDEEFNKIFNEGL